MSRTLLIQGDAGRLPSTRAVANWYGSNRMLARHVGDELAGCSWVGVPFAGGMSELLYIGARTLGINDAHRHVINLARVMADPALGPRLIRSLRRLIFHPSTLATAQERCRNREYRHRATSDLFNAAHAIYSTDLDWASDYFITSWMGRGGNAGTPAEFRGGLPLRWDAEGGGSATRFYSAANSIPAWRRVLRRCEFSTLDAFDFLSTCKDKIGIGIYCDPPFPGPGDKYTQQLGPNGQERLAEAVGRFSSARVVMRFYDVPLIRELYPDGQWTYVARAGRTQTNGEAPELLLINGPSLPPDAAGEEQKNLVGESQ